MGFSPATNWASGHDVQDSKGLDMKYPITWIAALALTAASAGANAFRVTPYVQNPATNAMTLMWLMQEDGTGTVAWQEIGGAGTGSGTTTPRLADELSYLPSQINYPNHFLPFTTPYS